MMAVRSTSAVVLLIMSAASAIGPNAALPADLTNGDFDARVQERPGASWVLMEFFASWCPACKSFAPIYETATDAISSSTASDDIWVARADCATETLLCNRFPVKGYPTVFLGRPGSFAKGAESELLYYDGSRTDANALVQWVAKHTGRSIEPRSGIAADAAAGGSTGNSTITFVPAAGRRAAEAQLDLTDVVTATIVSFRTTVDNSALMNGVAARQALKDYLDLLATAHPVSQCRVGAETAEAVLSKAWPNASELPQAEMFKKTHVCGRHFTEQPWGSCRGSSPGMRGYTCGLWLLFHSLAARVTGDTGGALWMTAVRGFMENFFPCDDCARHFAEMAAEDDALVVATPNDALLWSWRAHNRVNARVRKDEEANGDGDPAFPKGQWPPPELCADCRRSNIAGGDSGEDVEWHEAAVLAFLQQYYGNPTARAQTGRWHMQLHRKAAWPRSQRFSGQMFHGRRRRALSSLFWLLVGGAALLAIGRTCCGPQGRASPGGTWGQRGANGKFRQY